MSKHALKINKQLLNDLHTLAEEVSAEEIYIALRLDASNCNSIVRNLLVYGFQKISSQEAERFTTMNDYLLMKMDVNQEDDFVDI